MRIKMTTNLLLLLSILTTVCSCKGQTQTEKINKSPSTASIEKIRSAFNESIWSIYQDKRNHYWFGSNGNGVYYYDGKNLAQFTAKDGLVSNQIRVIQEDKFGNIYFDTADGVSKYDGHTFTTLQAVYSPENKWKSESEDLWFKGSGDINGVYRYDGDSLFHLAFPAQDLKKAFGLESEENRYSPYGVYGIYKDNSGHLWFGTLSAGAYRYNGHAFLWISEKELTVLDDGRVPGVRSIIEDKDGNFWLSNILSRYRIKETKKGKLKYEKLSGIEQSEGQTKMALPYFMSAVVDDKNGDLWILTYEEGVWRYDGEKFSNYLIKDGEKTVLLYSMYKDNQGMIWLGTHDAGVYKFDGNHFEKFKPQISNSY